MILNSSIIRDFENILTPLWKSLMLLFLIHRYSLMKGFEAQASNAVLDFTGDDDSQMRKKKNLMRWDVKKKKYVKAEQVNLIVLSHILISEIANIIFCDWALMYRFEISITYRMTKRKSRLKVVYGFLLHIKVIATRNGNKEVDFPICKKIIH